MAPAPPAPRMTPVALPAAVPEPPAAAADDDAAIGRAVAATPRNRIILADGVMPILKPPPVTVRVVAPSGSACTLLAEPKPQH